MIMMKIMTNKVFSFMVVDHKQRFFIYGGRSQKLTFA